MSQNTAKPYEYWASEWSMEAKLPAILVWMQKSVNSGVYSSVNTLSNIFELSVDFIRKT